MLPASEKADVHVGSDILVSCFQFCIVSAVVDGTISMMLLIENWVAVK
jgi:hypothetical protein